MSTIVRSSLALLLGASTAAALAAPMSAVLSVPGLDCTTWPLSITRDLARIDGVTAVVVDVDRRRVLLTFESATADPATFVQVLAEEGFASNVVRLTPRKGG